MIIAGLFCGDTFSAGTGKLVRIDEETDWAKYIGMQDVTKDLRLGQMFTQENGFNNTARSNFKSLDESIFMDLNGAVKICYSQQQQKTDDEQ